ncbi:hypothetical protein K438DRAFT_2129450 [Mycena galopus ATCC 62051]|nr:hypothetical protein K438DRAFT_2129450 [Mycena galopus ATCC 62051]
MSLSEIPPALLLVYCHPAPDVTPEKFNAWYDNEHVPTLLKTEGVLGGRRYNAIDGKYPEWMGIYDATSPNLLLPDIPHSHSNSKSEPESRLLADLEHHSYTLIATRTHPNMTPADLPADFIYASALDVAPETEDAFNEWYEGEHTDLLAKVPGWVRVRRYRLHRSQDDERPPRTYLALHEWRHAAFADMPEYVALNSTASANEMKEKLLGIEIRVFELQK